LPVGGETGAWLSLWAKYGWRDMLAAKPYSMTSHWNEAEKRLLWRDANGLNSTTERLRDSYRASAHSHPIDQVQQLYSADWLTEDLLMKADKMSMATSLEVREPFLDHRLAEWAAQLPFVWRIGDAATGYQSKRILRDFCRRRLPQSILERPKQGFPVPAYGWLAGGLKGWAEDLLFGSGSRVAELFTMEHAWPQMISSANGNLASAHKIWVLIILEHWLRAWT
jgi:asparagine synthase (glutamine-hydrolysing)